MPPLSMPPPPLPAPPPLPPPLPYQAVSPSAFPSVCSDTCERGSSSVVSPDSVGNAECEDGGEGASDTLCALGTDCTDCGPRIGSAVIIVISITVAGTVDDFTDAVADQYRDALAELLGLAPSRIRLTVSPASVRVEAQITPAPNAAVDALSGRLTADALTAAAQSVGLRIETVSLPILITLAAVPPSQPPSQPPLVRPSQPPPSQPLAGAGAGNGPLRFFKQHFMLLVALAAGVVAATLLLVACCLCRRHRMRRMEQSRKRRAAEEAHGQDLHDEAPDDSARPAGASCPPTTAAASGAALHPNAFIDDALAEAVTAPHAAGEKATERGAEDAATRAAAAAGSTNGAVAPFSESVTVDGVAVDSVAVDSVAGDGVDGPFDSSGGDADGRMCTPHACACVCAHTGPLAGVRSPSSEPPSEACVPTPPSSVGGGECATPYRDGGSATLEAAMPWASPPLSPRACLALREASAVGGYGQGGSIAADDGCLGGSSESAAGLASLLAGGTERMYAGDQFSPYTRGGATPAAVLRAGRGEISTPRGNADTGLDVQQVVEQQTRPVASDCCCGDTSRPSSVPHRAFTLTDARAPSPRGPSVWDGSPQLDPIVGGCSGHADETCTLLDSPRLDSPRLDSPRCASVELDSPRGAEPAGKSACQPMHSSSKTTTPPSRQSERVAQYSEAAARSSAQARFRQKGLRPYPASMQPGSGSPRPPSPLKCCASQATSMAQPPTITAGAEGRSPRVAPRVSTSAAFSNAVQGGMATAAATRIVAATYGSLSLDSDDEGAVSARKPSKSSVSLDDEGDDAARQAASALLAPAHVHSLDDDARRIASVAAWQPNRSPTPGSPLIDLDSAHATPRTVIQSNEIDLDEPPDLRDIPLDDLDV